MTLYQLSQIISINIRTKDIYPSIHQAVSELMETEFFCISLYESSTQTITDVYMIDNGQSQELASRPLEKGLFATVLKTGKSLLYHSFDSTTAAELGAVMVGDETNPDISQSILVVPLKIGAKSIGVISAQSYKPNMYTNADRETLELLAANVAIAIENARLFDEVQKLAITDPLTHLYNRRKFEETGAKEFDRSRRYNRPLCAIMIDLDQFKGVNDTYGHLAGDQVLTSLATLCQNNLRNIDILARYGGEEFVIILPETTSTQAWLIAERLRTDCEKTKVDSIHGMISLTISLGLAELNKSCQTLDELIDRAD
ncbi:GGDEF domain-containing protein, partial [bacterium]|nr:GGDEF domain-containing protein [bacterium]